MQFTLIACFKCNCRDRSECFYKHRSAFCAFFLWLAFFFFLVGLSAFCAFFPEWVFFFSKYAKFVWERRDCSSDKWAHYMAVEIEEEDLSLSVDHFWRKVFDVIDSSRDKFVVLPKMVKYVLALCHSNVDVERSLSVNKRMLIKMNTRMNGETINGMRSTKAAVQEYSHTSKVPITLEMIRAAQNSSKLYSQHTREEQQQRKKTKEKEKE